jgi:hypothetical protein
MYGTVGVLFSFVCAACSLDNLVRVDPATQEQLDPDVLHTYSGAVSLYRGTIGISAAVATEIARNTGLMTDELRADGAGMLDVDARNERGFQNAGNGVWPLLAATQRTIDALRQFPEQKPEPYLAELYALQGIAVVWLSEAYCSGVPLTKTPLTGNFVYTRGYTTTELLRHAVALFDTALAFGVDNERVATLARVGKGRALLNLNEYPAAEEAVRSVPTSHTYVVHFREGIALHQNLLTSDGPIDVVNAEGGNGLRWIAMTPALQDPRVRMTTQETGGSTLFTSPVRPAKYQGSTTIQHLADGIEARLIEAEAALRVKDTVLWAQRLNDLRVSAITPAIPPLSIDSTLSADSTMRVNVLFRERAYWLYLTGHRQGDLRRLIRQYGGSVASTYPFGEYHFPNDQDRIIYSPEVTMSASLDEARFNPLYRGCENRDP